MALEQARCSNCGGPIGLVGSMYRCEYCKSAYFPPVQCEVNGDGGAGTSSSSTLTTRTSSTWSTRSTRSSYSTSGTTWSSSTTTLPMSEEEKQAHWEWMEREQRRIEKMNRRAKRDAIAETAFVSIIALVIGFIVISGLTSLMSFFIGGQ